MARNNFEVSLLFWTLFLVILLQIGCLGKDEEPDLKEENEKNNTIGKNIEDYDEADLRKLLDQWEENDEDVDEDDRYDDDDPRRPTTVPTGRILGPVQLDPMTQLKLSKKGKTVLLFATVVGTPSKEDTEQISFRWHLSLYNAQFQVKRHLTAENRVLFVVKDGSLAWDIKDFLITQPECKMVEINHEQFPGAGAEQDSEKTEL